VTVGIGLACESGHSIILAADTRGTYNVKGIHANDEVGKQFDLPFGFYGTVAGRLAHCELVIAYLIQRLEEFKLNPQTLLHDHVRMAMRLAQADTVRDLYDNAMLKETGMRFDEWKTLMQASSTMYKRGKRIFSKTELVVELIIGGFAQGNFVLLSFVDKEPIQIVHGYETIGSGADLALNKLNDRGQNIHISFQRTVLHVAEALREAKLVPDKSVGEPADWIIIENGGKIRRLPARHQVILDIMGASPGGNSQALDADQNTRKKIASILYEPMSY
jgi:20S proteasome alpha/beta subunit